MRHESVPTHLKPPPLTVRLALASNRHRPLVVQCSLPPSVLPRTVALLLWAALHLPLAVRLPANLSLYLWLFAARSAQGHIYRWVQLLQCQ
jgi:hypothetical protein